MTGYDSWKTYDEKYEIAMNKLEEFFAEQEEILLENYEEWMEEQRGEYTEKDFLLMEDEEDYTEEY